MLTAFIIWISAIGGGFIFFGILYKLGVYSRLKRSTTADNKSNVYDKRDIVSSNDRLSYIYNKLSNSLSFETPQNGDYIPRTLISIRGSWRAAQGNIYTNHMLKKDIENEFNERL